MANRSMVETLEKMEQILLQGQQTDSNKDDIISELKIHVISLRGLLESTELKQVDKDGPSNSGNKLKVFRETKTPDEDLNHQWKVCACDSADCETCEAEKEAILSATRWFDQDKDIHIDTHSNTESDSQSYIHAGSEEDSETHIYKNTGEDGLTTFRGQMLQICPQLDKTRCVVCSSYNDTQQVSIEVDTTFLDTNYTTRNIIRLHESLSVTAFPDCHGSRYVSGVVCLLLAERLVSLVQYTIFVRCGIKEFLTHEMYEIISSSLREGLDIYMANYGDNSRKLYIKDILLLLSHLGLTLSTETVLPSVSIEYLATCISCVKDRQILVLIRLHDYNMWCICRNIQHGKIIVLDCQSHKVFDCYQSKEIQYGGVIYTISPEYDAIISTLQVMQKYSGPFTGPHNAAVVEV